MKILLRKTVENRLLWNVLKIPSLTWGSPHEDCVPWKWVFGEKSRKFTDIEKFCSNKPLQNIKCSSPCDTSLITWLLKAWNGIVSFCQQRKYSSRCQLYPRSRTGCRGRLALLVLEQTPLLENIIFFSFQYSDSEDDSADERATKRVKSSKVLTRGKYLNNIPLKRRLYSLCKCLMEFVVNLKRNFDEIYFWREFIAFVLTDRRWKATYADVHGKTVEKILSWLLRRD